MIFKISNHNPSKVISIMQLMLDRVENVKFYKENGRYYFEFIPKEVVK